MKTQASLAIVATFLTSLASAVEYANISGSNFINTADNSRLDIIGVTYVSVPSLYWSPRD